MAPTAAAAPTGGSNAADTVKTLRDMGYNAQPQRTLVSGPLAQCIATGVHGLANDATWTVFTTAYVDISCPVE